MTKFNRKDYSDVIEKYNDDAMEYCLEVLEARILAGKLIKLACLRHLDDLKRIGSDEFNFDYDLKKARGIINFANIVPDVSGAVDFHIAKFQKFIYSTIWGWKNNKTGGARFKTVYLSMARTNGKTQIAANFALADFLMGYPSTSRQIVVASNTTDQVMQLYNYIRKIAWWSLKETDYFKPFSDLVQDNTREMRIDSENTRLIKLSAESIGGDSVHPSLTIFDEYHLQKSTDFLDSLSSGNVQNVLAKTIYISTAGTDPRVPMREDYTAYSEALEKKKLDDEILFLCWEQDNDDEAFKPETWIKSNPLMEIADMKEKLTAGLLTERNKQVAAGALPKFLVKNMNRWQNAKKNAYIDLKFIQDAIIDDFDMYHREVYLGYDASLSNDDTSLVALIPYKSAGRLKFHVWEHSFIPTRVAGGIEAKMKRDTINYIKAEQDGYCEISKNRFGTVNQDNVFRYLMSTIEQFGWKVLGFGYDAHLANDLVRAVNDLNGEWQIFSIRQGAISLSEPTKWLQDSFLKGDITMSNDPILKAGLSNAILTDKNNELLIDKNMNSAKIDVVDALIDAAYEGMLYDTGHTNAKENKEKSAFSGMNSDQIREHFMSKNLFG